MLLELTRKVMAMPSRKHQEVVCDLARVLAAAETDAPG
jgi:hypothetical protein